MNAIVLNKFGSADNLEIAEVNDPVPDDNEVLMSVKAISINPEDINIRSGRGMFYSLPPVSPVILGWDLSGVVVGLGKSVSSFKIGDELFGMISFPGKGGAYAEIVAASGDQLALKPGNISHEEAAAAGMSALTAIQSVINVNKIREGQRVLIHAASEGVGHYAVQMAKYLGAYVVGASYSSQREFVLGLGADECYDYQGGGSDQISRNFDFVLDTMGGSNIKYSLKMINWGGTLVSTWPDPRNEISEIAQYDGIVGISKTVQANGSDMKRIADMLNSYTIGSHVDSVFSFEKIADAHRRFERGDFKGKIIITV